MIKQLTSNILYDKIYKSVDSSISIRLICTYTLVTDTLTGIKCMCTC
nr:MAG TPA: hypothetical protein [Caudoviricetes sp.]